MRPFFLLGLLASACTAAAFVPACGHPEDEGAPAAVDGDASKEDDYTTVGSCDGLPRLSNLKTPPGVCVGLVSKGYTYARGIAQTSNGDLVLAEMGGWAQDRGGIWLLRRKADKTFERVRLMTAIDKPSGIAIGPDGLVYVGTPANIFRFDPYETVSKTGPLPATARQPRLKLVVKDLPGEGRHPLKRFVFAKSDPWTMYVNLGSGTDNCEQGTTAPPAGFPLPCPEATGDNARGAIRKYVLGGPDHLGTTFTTIAHGLRNSMALAIHPTSGAIIQGENSRDTVNKYDQSLTDQEGDLPHEELNVVVEGSDYGWPYCMDNGTPAPEYRGRVDCSNKTNPALLLPGHVSPLGMAFYTGTMFPTAYRNNLLVTFHGYRAYGHRLVLVPTDSNGIPGGGQPLDIIRGWEKSANGVDPMGAPVDVMVAKDGSIYVTEDKNGDVLRVFFDPAAGNGAPMPPVAIAQPQVSPEEHARCQQLAGNTTPMGLVEKNVIDVACVSCHGVGPGYAGGLRLDKCDVAGNGQRLLAARSGGRPPYVVPHDVNSELVKRLKGDGYPQMPAGGVTQEQLDDVTGWIHAGAPIANVPH